MRGTTDMLYPEPSSQATRINEPATIELEAGERGTIAYEIENRTSELILPIVAISKYTDCIYEIRADGNARYGPAQIPPTDIDDLNVTFLPALRFADSLTVEVSNLGSVPRTIHIQPIGWEPAGDE